MKKCFVIAPIKGENSHERSKINDLIENYFKKILTDYDVEISHQISTIGRITSQVITKIFQSNLVIADITSVNGNVMYELGVADTLQKPVITICENNTALPFDKYDQRTIMYDYVPYAMAKFDEDFRKAVGSLKNLERGIENTVTQSIGFEYLTRNIDISAITKNAAYNAGIDSEKSSKIVHSVKEYIDELKTFDADSYVNSVKEVINNLGELFNERIIKKEQSVAYGDYIFDYKIILNSRTIYFKIIKSLAMVAWSHEADVVNYLKTKYSDLRKRNVHAIFIIPQIKNAGKSRRGISMLKYNMRSKTIVNYAAVLQDIVKQE